MSTLFKLKQRVKHKKFGYGYVVDFSKQEECVTVEFDKAFQEKKTRILDPYCLEVVSICAEIPENISFNDGSLIILDLDATVFDTDHLRIERKYRLNYAQLKYIDYIKGFAGIFLNNENSYFHLSKYTVLIVTSNRVEYVKTLLNNHSEFKKYIKDENIICTSSKKTKILEYLKGKSFENIFAFGDDETDANVYSEVKARITVPSNFRFYIVKNYLGYPDERKILDEMALSTNFFRNNYLYRKIASPGDSNFFDNIVVYFKYYNATDTEDFKYGNYWGRAMPPRIIGSKVIKPDIRYGCNFDFGREKKNFTIRFYVEDFCKTLNDLPRENVIYARIPGSTETSLDESCPMEKLLDQLAVKNNVKINKGLLLRNKEVEQSKDGNRSFSKHINSIKITAGVRGKTIILLDDICTSGASFAACSHLLYQAGAGHVICVAIAQTCGSSPVNNIE